ncbi:hypothetical protein P7H12_12745 [Paenibacillus larvae]|nr:hypothetical protein [Paenibacillus larvae]MDT2264283.1 hypothetical protein [Paenibacillus larvae]
MRNIWEAVAEETAKRSTITAGAAAMAGKRSAPGDAGIHRQLPDEADASYEGIRRY